MSLYFRKTLGTLRPADAEAEEALDAIPEGSLVRAPSLTRPRSLPHHKLFFALLKKVYEQSAAKERFPNLAVFRATVTIGAGHFDWSEANGYRFPVAKTIKFSAMDQTEFNEFFNAAVDCICNTLHLVDDGDLRREFAEMLGEAA